MKQADEVARPTCGHCGLGVDRRTFLSAAALAAVAAMLDACTGLTSPGFYSGAVGGPLTVKVSNYAALATAGMPARVDGGSGAPTALVRTGSSSFVGVSMVCTHQGATIDVNGAGFFCPNHGAQYAATGTWRGGQPTSSLPEYAATFDGVDTVVIARPA